MDLKDFMQLHPPATKTSRFEAFKAELRTLQKNKYTIEQMLEFLQANGIQATRSSLYAFLKKSRIVRVAPQKGPAHETEKTYAKTGKGSGANLKSAAMMAKT
jgi:arginine repressor